MQRTIIAQQGRDSLLAAAIGKDGKGKFSPVFYLIAIPLAFVSQRIANSLHLSNPITTFVRPSFTMTAQASTIAFPSEKLSCRR